MALANKNWVRYQERIARVIDYIHANPGSALDGETLAEVAHLSSYHWHRIYRAITGETAATTVRRSRLHKAASDLLRTENSIAAIGASVGYPDLQSFTRTFKSHYGVAPGQFRQSGQLATELPLKNPAVDEHRPVQIVEWPVTNRVGLSHAGDYLGIGVTCEKVMATCAMEGLPGEDPRTLGVYFDDPEAVPNEALRSFAGLAVDADAALPATLEQYSLAGGRYAMLIHQGPYARLEYSYLWLYTRWFPESGYAVRDMPCCEVYLNSPVTTEPDDLRTAICLPIE